MVFGKSTKVLGDFSSYIIIAYKFVEGYKVESFTTSLTGRCRRCKARRHVSLNQSARRNLPAADPENLSQFHKKTLPPRPIPVWHINSSWRVRAPQEETYIVSDECARARHRAHLTWKLKLVRRPGGPFLPTGPSLSASVDRYAFSCSRQEKVSIPRLFRELCKAARPTDRRILTRRSLFFYKYNPFSRVSRNSSVNHLSFHYVNSLWFVVKCLKNGKQVNYVR